MKKLLSVGIVFLMFVTGCNTSKITSSWKAEDFVPQKYNKIMVLGLIREADRSIQEKMENHLVDELKNLGYYAVSSMKEYGPKAFYKMNEEEALGKIKDSGVDAVITIVLLDKQREKRYVTTNIYYSPYGYYHNHFWGYSTSLYYRIYQPGYYVTENKYFWESNLYDMKTQRLVYSVQTQSFDPSSSESLGHEYGEMIIQNMVRNNVIKKVSDLPHKAF